MQYAQVSEANFEKYVKDPDAAIRYGMSFERDSILFFGELLRHMTPLHREKIAELINEEKKHLIYLANIRSRYEPEESAR